MMTVAKAGIFNQPYGTKIPKVSGPSGACGDYYGTGFKAKIGKMRDSSVGYRPVTRKQLGTPPKSVV